MVQTTSGTAGSYSPSCRLAGPFEGEIMGKTKSKISTPTKSKSKTTTPEPQKIPDWTPEAAERIIQNLRTLAMGPSGSAALELAKRTDELLGPISGRLCWQGYDDPDHRDMYWRGEAVRRVLGDDELCLMAIIGETQEILTAIHIGVVRDHHADHLRRLADELESAFKGPLRADLQGVLGPSEIARREGLDPGPLRKRLERRRKQDHNCYVEVENRTGREPQYLYRIDQVRDIIDGLKGRRKAT